MHTHDTHLPWCDDGMTECGCEAERYLIAGALCIVIICIQLIGWLLSQSLALLGDTGHVSVDWLGLWIAAFIAYRVMRNKSEENKIRSVGLAVQVALLVIVVGWLFVGSFERFYDPIDVVPAPLMIAATIGLSLNGVQLWILHPGFTNKNMRAARLHAFQDLLSSIGVVASGIIIWISGWVYTDPIVSTCIALWLMLQIYLLMTDKHTH
jgi:cobalt-zinc-cadmium efflux system protein